MALSCSGMSKISIETSIGAVGTGKKRKHEEIYTLTVSITSYAQLIVSVNLLH